MIKFVKIDLQFQEGFSYMDQNKKAQHKIASWAIVFMRHQNMCDLWIIRDIFGRESTFLAECILRLTRQNGYM